MTNRRNLPHQSSVENEVKTIVAKFSCSGRPLALSDDLSRDLLIDGDDAENLLFAVKIRFETDFEGLNVQSFFFDEVTVTLSRLVIAVRKWLRLPPETRKPFTLGHLINVVNAGKWFEP